MWKFALSSVLLTSLAVGVQGLSSAELQKMGPQVGERVPDFSLVDQTGATRTLRSLAGKNGTMLVFFRSADW